MTPNISFSPISPSDHLPIFTTLTISPPSLPALSTCTFRSLNCIDTSAFIRDILVSRLITHSPSNLTYLIDTYNPTLTSILNNHAPFQTKILRSKASQLWFTPALHKLKSTRRRLERVWLRTHSSLDLNLFRSAYNHYHSAIIKAKRLFNSNLISANISNPRKLWT